MLVNLNIVNKDILVVGGGQVALRKVIKLLNYSCHITLVSPVYLSEFNELDISIINTKFSYDLLENKDIVFLCTDNNHLHNEIINYAKDLKVLINNSTSQNNMDFAMAASFNYDGFEIAVTSNKGVQENKNFKNYLKNQLSKE